MESRGGSRRRSAWLQPPQSARSSAALIGSEEEEDLNEKVSSRSSDGDRLRLAGNEHIDVLLEENADLTDRLSRAERKLHHAKREVQALREKVLEYEAKERLAAADDDACNAESAPKAKKAVEKVQKAVAFRTSVVRPRQRSLELPRKTTDHEQQESFRQQLSDLESRYAVAMTEGATLRAELAEVEQLGQYWLMDVEEVRDVLQETQQLLETERVLLKEAQDEARRLRDELHSLRLNQEDGKVVLAHRSSLFPTDLRRNRKLVTANLMSQLETTSTCTETSEDAVGPNVEETRDSVPEEVPETLHRGAANKREERGQDNTSGGDDTGDGTSSSHTAGAAEKDASSMLHRRSCELFCELEEARLVKERLQKTIGGMQIQLAQTEARLRQEQYNPARRKSREILEAREAESAARETEFALELQTSRKSEAGLQRTVRDLEQRLVLMERIATDWKRRAQSSQGSVWHRIGISVWSSSFCATSRVGVAPAA